MGEFYNISKAAKYIGVSTVTLRTWDKEGVLVPIRSNGGHRRYTEEQLNKFIGERKNGYNYTSLYEHLCKAYEISNFFNDEDAIKIMEIRDNVGRKLLSQYQKS